MNDEQETPTLWRHMLQLPIIISSRRNGQVVAQEVLRLFARESELVMQLAQLAGSAFAVVGDNVPIIDVHDHVDALAPWEVLAEVAGIELGLLELLHIAQLLDQGSIPDAPSIRLTIERDGYSGKPDLAKAVNVFYLQILSLRCSVFFDYVPSKANIADLPSRRSFVRLSAELAGLRGAMSELDALLVPSVASWHAPLSSWATRHPAVGDQQFPV